MEDKNNSVTDNSNNNEVEILDFDDSKISSDNTNDEFAQNEVVDTINNDEKNIQNEQSNKNHPKEKVVKKEVVKKVVQDKETNIEKEKTKNNKADNNQKQENNNDKPIVKEVIIKKRSIMPSIIMTLVFLLLIGVIFALPYIKDYLDGNSTQKSDATTNQDIIDTNSDDGDESFKSDIDVNSVLTKIRDIKSYTYENIVDVYVKDNNSQSLSIKNDNIFSFNETKYKVEMNKIVANFSYDTVDYYEKLDDVYNVYLQDITTKEYTKSETTLDKFNIIYNIFPNMIDYLINDNEVISEKQIIVDNENHIDITLETSIDILKNLSLETNRIQSKIDISKLTIDNVNLDLYFDESKNLYKIEFSLEDKNIYQDDIDGEIESAVAKYTFTDFNKVKDITLPNIE